MTRSLRDEIAERLARDIESGMWAPGEQLPGERVLAQRFGASRPVIREALRIIEGAGLINIYPTRGVFVRMEVGSGVALIGHLITSLSRLAMSHFAEAREFLECHIAMQAAQSARESDIEGLSLFLAMMERNRSNPEAFKQADLAFHRQLADATRNPIYAAWIDVVLRALSEKRYAATGNDAVRGRIILCHRQILDAIIARDAEAARRAVETHIAQFVTDEAETSPARPAVRMAGEAGRGAQAPN